MNSRHLYCVPLGATVSIFNGARNQKQTVYTAADGKLYGTDEDHDKLWVLDPRTGGMEAIDLPKSDLPRGGVFSGMHLAIGIFTGSHGPHSMAQTTDGRIDPRTLEVREYDTPLQRPRRPRFDKDSIFWIPAFDRERGCPTGIRAPHLLRM